MNKATRERKKQGSIGNKLDPDQYPGRIWAPTTDDPRWILFTGICFRYTCPG